MIEGDTDDTTDKQDKEDDSDFNQRCSDAQPMAVVDNSGFLQTTLQQDSAMETNSSGCDEGSFLTGRIDAVNSYHGLTRICVYIYMYVLIFVVISYMFYLRGHYCVGVCVIEVCG